MKTLSWTWIDFYTINPNLSDHTQIDANYKRNHEPSEPKQHEIQSVNYRTPKLIRK